MQQRVNPNGAIVSGTSDGMQSVHIPYMKPDEVRRYAAMLGVVVSITDERMQTYLDALQDLLEPPAIPDIVNVPAAGSYRYTLVGGGLVKLSKLLLMAPGGTYPSRVDVVVNGISHLPFTLTSQKPELGPFGFLLMAGSADAVFTNPDATNAANVYVEWTRYAPKSQH